MASLLLYPVKKLGPIELDAVISESHSSQLTVTDNPIEDGSTIADHAYMNPRQITITGGISNYPMVQRNSGITNGAQIARVSAAWQQLLDFQQSAVPFDLQTGLKLYRNMLITNLDVTQDASTANILLFRAQLREVKLVSALSVVFPASRFTASSAAANKTTSTAQRGSVDTAPVNESALSKLRGVFAQ